MSIKSIDSQIMVARTADFARENSAVQKRTEIIQDSLAARERLNDVHDQSRVVGTIEADPLELRPDEDGGLGAAYEEGSGSEENKEEEPEYSEKDFMVPPSNNIIDIRV